MARAKASHTMIVDISMVCGMNVLFNASDLATDVIQ
jgi:hypothetical protein